MPQLHLRKEALFSLCLLGCGASTSAATDREQVERPPVTESLPAAASEPGELPDPSTLDEPWAVDLGDVVPGAVAVQADGAVVYAVNTLDKTSNAPPSTALVRLTTNGLEEWRVDAPANLSALEATGRGTTIAVGSRVDSAASLTTSWVGEFGVRGELLWSQSLSADDAHLGIRHVGVDASGVWLLGHQLRWNTLSKTLTTHSLAAHIGREGTLDWVHRFEGREDPLELSVTPSDGTAVFAFQLNSGAELHLPDRRYTSERFTPVLVALDRSGEVAWSQELQPSSEDLVSSVTRARDGGWLVAGSRPYYLQTTRENAFAAKIDASGTRVWRREFEGGTQLEGADLLETESRLVFSARGHGADGSSALLLMDLDGQGNENKRISFEGAIWATIRPQADNLVLLGQFRGELAIAGQNLSTRPGYDNTFVARLTP